MHVHMLHTYTHTYDDDDDIHALAKRRATYTVSKQHPYSTQSSWVPYGNYPNHGCLLAAQHSFGKVPKHVPKALPRAGTFRVLPKSSCLDRSRRGDVSQNSPCKSDSLCTLHTYSHALAS